jgi:hypothetical protein
MARAWAVLFVALASALTAAPVAAEARAPDPREVARFVVDPERGFTTLGMVYAPDVKAEVQRVIEDDAQWQSAWRDFGFRGPLPELDFRTRRAVVFIEPAPCAGRGRGGVPVVALHQFADGALVPRFDGSDSESITCADVLILPRVRGYAYALAFPRVAARGALHVSREPRLGPPAPDPRPCNDCSPATPLTERVSPDGSVALPPPGRTLLARLGDETPVWVVRHHDGSVSALAADAPFAPEWLPGFRRQVSWDPRTRRLGAFDEWGTHPSGRRPGLERYQLESSGSRVRLGPRASVTAPGRYSPARIPQPGEQSVGAARGPFDELPPRALRQALGSPVGSWSRVAEARLSVEAGSAELCALEAARGVPPTCASVRRLAAPSGCRGSFDGSFAVRRDEVGRLDVIDLGAHGDYHCRTADGLRGPWDPVFAWGLDTLTFAATAAVASGVQSSSVYLGPELALTLRYRWRRWDRPARRSFWQGQLGDTLEVTLRARRLTALAASENERDSWLVGVAPSFATRIPYQHFGSTTLLGFLLPELGVAVTDSVRPFVGLRFAAEYRLSPAGQRQRPYRIDERLAFELSPHFWAVLTDVSPTYGGGVSLGLTAW